MVVPLCWRDSLSDQRVVDANYNHALVLFQYFTYLRRSPDEAGLQRVGQHAQE